MGDQGAGVKAMLMDVIILVTTEWQGFKPGTSPFFTQIQEILWDACVIFVRICTWG